ncbi:MAG: hypothetical protein JWR85_2372 [Marmoricola sp.]|nr:hypothetical protein [Marmoricola sp.]
MKVIGKLFSGVVLVVAAVGVVVGVRSVPDLKRYLRMRKM